MAAVASEQIPLPKGADFPDTGEVCAAAIFNATDLTLVWCNDAYMTFIAEPYRSQGAVGVSYEEISPLGFALHAEDIRMVNETGEPRSGVDQIFSVEDGILRYSWTMQQPQPNLVLTLVRRERPSAEQPAPPADEE